MLVVSHLPIIENEKLIKRLLINGKHRQWLQHLCISFSFLRNYDNRFFFLENILVGQDIELQQLWVHVLFSHV
jgi:hypothetical protein